MAKKKTAKTRATRTNRKTPRPHEAVGREKLKEQLVSFDPTKEYKGRPWYSGREEIIEDLPFFRLWYAQMMLFDPIVRQALNARDAVLSAVKIKVASKNKELAAFITEQWESLWARFAPMLLKTKRYGYGAFQVGFEENNGRTVIEDLKQFAPQDCLPAVQGGRTVGIFVRGGMTNTKGAGEKPILNPRGLWTTFDAEFGMRHGRSIMRRSFGPWWEKWMDHGSKKTTQLRMIKDAYRGDVFWANMFEKLTLPNGDELLVADVLREAAENMMAGSAAVLPLAYDSTGNKKYDYTPPTDSGNPQAIWTWGDNNDRDIRAGMDVTEEIILAASSGSGFSGRTIPFIMFLQACMIEGMELLQAVDSQLLRVLAWINFGNNADYKIKLNPLMDTFADAVGGSQMGGSAMGGGQEDNGQPGRKSQFEAFQGPRGGTGAKNIDTGQVIGGKRGQELLERQ